MSDPYRDRTLYHKADLFREDGSVSALCFRRPRRINLKVATWTLDDDDVTCRKCLKKIKEPPCES